MKNLTLLILFAGIFLSACNQMITNENKYPAYDGDDMGVVWQPDHTTFRVYSPEASEVMLHLYNAGNGGEVVESVPMEKSEGGTWYLSLPGDNQGKYYTFQIKYRDVWLNETPGIYVKATGVNGQRGMITDFSKTDPHNWDMDVSPELKSKNEVVLYELQVRDFSIAPNSGMENKGLFLAFTENGVVNKYGDPIGIDHIADMGVTHVHLLPSFDFRSIDESQNRKDYNYNWGYDPQNYNVPEGSFSSDPFNAEVRIKEFKEMVMAMHKKGIRVIMDVVYNHTGFTENSSFNLLAPGYYYRKNSDGSWSNASACGNETASEKHMMRKYMVESLMWWMDEYHIDGFRFDLMGIHDIETMNIISQTLHEANPSVFLYGEGWTAGSTPLPDSLLALKKNTMMLDRIAAFSDDLRDGIKGHWSSETDSGFVTGKRGTEESVKFGVVASCFHPQISYAMVNYSDTPWSDNPAKTINYVTCHDNHTLYDKIKLTDPKATEQEVKDMHKLSAAIILTSQGIPFIHAGMEFMRTKQGEHNSFESPDTINQIDWDMKSQNADVVQYVKDLIQFRKAHPALRMPDQEMIKTNLAFYPNKEGVVSYKISGYANGDAFKEIVVIYNARRKAYSFSEDGSWVVVFDKDGMAYKPVPNGSVMVPPLSMMILTVKR